MKNLIEYILIHIVENPEDVKIETEPNEQGTTYIITVHPDDMGRVIGKKGSIIQSIRAIARVRAMKEGERANIIVADPRDGNSEASQAKSDANSQPETETSEVPVQPEVSVQEDEVTPEVDKTTQE